MLGPQGRNGSGQGSGGIPGPETPLPDPRVPWPPHLAPGGGHPSLSSLSSDNQSTLHEDLLV